ncbi:MAG: hypothetical protein ACK5DL_08175 [Burkholderiales bacterium]|jgi:hypothetical protein
MSQREIKFRTTGCNAVFGNFSSGDVARVSAELAKHFVEEVGCAEYVGDKSDNTTDAAKPKATRKKK